MLDELGIEGRSTDVHEASEDALLTAKAAVLFYSLDNGFIEGPRRHRTVSPPPERPRSPAPSTKPTGKAELKDATNWSQVEPPSKQSERSTPDPASRRSSRQRSAILWTLVVIVIVIAILLGASPDMSPQLGD
jgi:hypothetical protein